MILYIIFVSVVVLFSQVDGCPRNCSCIDTVVDCSNQQLLIVPEGIPSTTTHLILRRNNITTLENVNFSPIPLIHLDLSHNRITSIDVSGLDRIEELLLDFNMLTQSSIDDLNELTSTLRKLSLSHNRIAYLPYRAFYYHRELTYVDLSYNDIYSVGGRRFPDQSISFLNLSHNPITGLNFRRYYNLRVLDLREQALTSMTLNYFRDNTVLESLYLGGKTLAYLSDYLFQGPSKLVSLTISNTSLTSFPATMFSEVPNLKTLDISENSMLSSAITIPDSNRLENLIMDGTALRYVTATSLPFISFASLKNTSLRLFPTNIFSVAPSVAILDLSRNSINSLLLDNLVNTTLQALNVSHNAIDVIADNFFKTLPSLRSIDVSYNRLRRLEPSWFSGRTGLREFVTGHNDWTCDCAMAFVERENIGDSKISFVCARDHPFNSTANLLPPDEYAAFCFECASPPAFQGGSFRDIPKPLRDDCTTPDSQIKTSLSELTTTAAAVSSSSANSSIASNSTSRPIPSSSASSDIILTVLPVAISVTVVLTAVAVVWILIRKRLQSQKSRNNQAPTYTNEVAYYGEFGNAQPSIYLPADAAQPAGQPNYAFADNGANSNEGYYKIQYAPTTEVPGRGAEEDTYENVDVSKFPYALASNIQMQGISTMDVESNHYELDTNHYEECSKSSRAVETTNENIYVDPHYVDPDSVPNPEHLNIEDYAMGVNPYSAAGDNLSLNTQSLATPSAPAGNFAQLQVESHYELDVGGKRTSYMDFCKQ